LTAASSPSALCPYPGCAGEPAPPYDRCFAHLADGEVPHAVGQAVSDKVVVLRGVPLKQATIDRIVAALPTAANGHKLATSLDCKGATLVEDVTLRHVEVDTLWLDRVSGPHQLKLLSVTLRGRATLNALDVAILDWSTDGPGSVRGTLLDVTHAVALHVTAGNRTIELSGRTHTWTIGGEAPHLTLTLPVEGELCDIEDLEVTRLSLDDSSFKTFIPSDVRCHVALSAERLHATDVELARIDTPTLVLSHGRVTGDVTLSELTVPRLDAVDLHVGGELVVRGPAPRDLDLRDLCVGVLDVAAADVASLDLSGLRAQHVVADRLSCERLIAVGPDVAGHLSLRHAAVSRELIVEGGRAGEGLSLNGLACTGRLAINELTVEADVGAQAMTVSGTATLVLRGCAAVDASRSTFAGDAALVLDAERVMGADLRFAARAELTVSADEVALPGALIEGRGELDIRAVGDVDAFAPVRDVVPCTLSLPGFEPRQPFSIDGHDEVRIVDLRRARTDQLRISRSDLTTCPFAGAMGVDQLRVPSAGFREIGHGVDRRIVLAEDPDSSAAVTKLDPDSLAQLYRSLRKGLEDAKDDPGAAAFYVSEMHARRRMPRRSPSERAILGSYRVFGGYGVRPVWPLVWLVSLLLGASLIAWGTGAVAASTPTSGTGQPARACRIVPGPGATQVVRCPAVPAASRRDAGYGEALLVLSRATLGFSRALDDRITSGGQALVIVVRILGAALLTMFLLGVRAAVKR
jgi:hypothetical protein